jgi:hypothetical protein
VAHVVVAAWAAVEWLKLCAVVGFSLRSWANGNFLICVHIDLPTTYPTQKLTKAIIEA